MHLRDKLTSKAPAELMNAVGKGPAWTNVHSISGTILYWTRDSHNVAVSA